MGNCSVYTGCQHWGVCPQGWQLKTMMKTDKTKYKALTVLLCVECRCPGSSQGTAGCLCEERPGLLHAGHSWFQLAPTASLKCIKEGETLHCRIMTEENCDERPSQPPGERRRGEGAPECTGSTAAWAESHTASCRGLPWSRWIFPKELQAVESPCRTRGKVWEGGIGWEVVRNEHRPYSPPYAAPGVEWGAVEVEELGPKEWCWTRDKGGVEEGFGLFFIFYFSFSQFNPVLIGSKLTFPELSLLCLW